MPISPENRARYPVNWKTEVRPRILARANNCCERCLVPNGVTVVRTVFCGRPAYELGEAVHDANTGELLAEGFAMQANPEEGHQVRIVLTIAHTIDQDPANCDDDNLQALCQRCHNRLDQAMRMANAAATRRGRKAAGDLFEVTPCP